MATAFDFPAISYLERIGLKRPLSPTPAALLALHEAQIRAIPFETVGPYLSAPVSLEKRALYRKLIRDRRGGYCFELNGLFTDALMHFGFRARPLLARVLIGNAQPGPLTHQIILVEFTNGAEKESWITDVGFGSPGPRRPLRLRECIVRDGDRDLRLRPDESLGWVLEQRRGKAWEGIYAFEERFVREIDREMGNHFTGTWPRSIFRRKFMACLHTAEGRLTLDDRTFRRYGHAGLLEEREIRTARALGDTLRHAFGIVIGATTLRKLYEKLSQEPARDQGEDNYEEAANPSPVSGLLPL